MTMNKIELLYIDLFCGARCQSIGDIEIAHIEADGVLKALLNSLGYEDVVKEWEKVEKWYA